MKKIDIDGMTFNFPENFDISKYDDWIFYRNHFSKQMSGLKGVDAIAVSDKNSAYLIEVKDYRHPDTVKPSELPDAIAKKVIFTLAAMLPASLNARIVSEKSLASKVLNCQSIQVVAHIEMPQSHRPVVSLADIKQKLKIRLRAIDAHPKIVSHDKMQNLPWSTDL